MQVIQCSHTQVDLTRPVDNFYGLPGNYTSRLDFYVHSYHLMRSSGHRNRTKFSRCTPDNMCLRVSDVPFRNNCRPGHLVSIYLVADPDLDCRVDFGTRFRLNYRLHYFCTVVYRALLLAGCNTTTVAMHRDNLFAIGAKQLIVKFHSLRFIVPGRSSKNSYRLNLSGRDLTAVFQNCHFLALAPNAGAVSVSSVITQHSREPPFPLLQFTMINCTMEVLKPDKGGASFTSSPAFFSVSSGPSAMINISFSQFYGLYALHITCDAGNEIPVLRRVWHSPVQVCKVFISHCDFIKTRGDHAARFDHVISEHFTTHAFVEMSNVRIVNGAFSHSPLLYRCFDNIRMANCSFLNLTCITQSCVRGIDSSWTRTSRNTLLGRKGLRRNFGFTPTELGFHFTNCIFGGQPYLKPKAATYFEMPPICSTPFVYLLTAGLIDGLPNKLAARFKNLVMHDTYNPTAGAGLLCASCTDVVIDGMTDIR